MKKFTISPNLVDLIRDYRFFSEKNGVLALDKNAVSETKSGSKFFYSLNSDFRSLYTKIAKIIGNQYLSRIPINKSACAYVADKSYLDFLEPHRNNYFFLRLDLKSFFSSISEELVRSSILEYFSKSPLFEGCEQSHADAIFHIISYKTPKDALNIKYADKFIIPMGFPLSPNISNIVFRKTDILIERFCDRNDITYTRYADDMLFSARGVVNDELHRILHSSSKKFEKNYLHSEDFEKQISILLGIDGFNLNNSKTIRATDTISLNGYTISGVNFADVRGDIRISNKKTKIIEKLIHEINKGIDDTAVFNKCFSFEFPKPRYRSGFANFELAFCRDQINNKLLGYKSYLVSLFIFDKKFHCITSSAKLKYSKIIQDIDLILKKRINNLSN